MNAPVRTTPTSATLDATTAIPAHVAAHGHVTPLPTGSAIDLQVRLERLANLHEQVAMELREIAAMVDGMSLDFRAERALMSPMSKTLLSARDVAARIGVNERTIRHWRREGKMPRGVEFAGAIVRWREAEIEEWIAR